MVAAGFLVLAVCPGAAYGPPFAGIARANVPLAVGLMVILAGTSTIISPALLHVLLPWASGGEAPDIDLMEMLGTLLATQIAAAASRALVEASATAACGSPTHFARAGQQSTEPDRRRTHLGEPIPHACRYSTRGGRRDADFVGREPSHRLASSRSGTEQSPDHGAYHFAAKRCARPGYCDRKFRRYPRRVRCLGLRDRGGTRLASRGSLVGKTNLKDGLC